ncbi:NUDIX domain-containing protein [Phycicoccus endophyticus]|uniref:NUDIX domain-containing protein n=1 Tax=Phycicoccus endophyticus TaxID=1690220 RepID=A0A7G9R5P9_9MICO|nr:NUDIX domain-containing protein [Phycicoccus endophyticus]QNN50924.1 NUDIX domain-containing protein [Phycicoccus endophyticus]
MRVSAVVLQDGAGRLLTVRERGTHRFMLVGGKHEPGETAEQTAVREAAEEVGVDLDLGRLVRLGRFTARAANEEGRTVESVVFTHPPVPMGDAPASEIEEQRWLDPRERPWPDDLAPLLAEHVLPALSPGE